MKRMKKWIVGGLCGIFALSASFASCGGGAGEDDLSQGAPDYSTSNKEFMTWAYAATYDGWWQTIDENENFIRLENSAETPVAVTTKESLQEYKEFSTLFEEDLYNEIDLQTCVEKRISKGGVSEASQLEQIKFIEERLTND